MIDRTIKSVSFLMPVRITNDEEEANFKTALKSIMRQFTSEGDLCEDYQIIIVDDGNAMKAVDQILVNAPNNRITLDVVKMYDHEAGIACVLNEGLKYCTGDLIIRMDADDIASPILLDSHIKFFDIHPEVDVCGVQMNAFHYVTQEQLIGVSFPTHHPSVITREWAYYEGHSWFVNHPGVAYRKTFIDDMHGYREARFNDQDVASMEDLMLWIDTLRSGRFIYNQRDILIDYRWRPAPQRQTQLFCDARNHELQKLMQ